MKEHFYNWMMENRGIQDANNYRDTDPEEIAIEYAEYHARSFANWLSNQVIAGRTMDQLWRDYLKLMES